MLENIRKYTGLMVIVIILLAAGLILTMSNTRPGGSQTIMTVNGIGVSNTEYYRSGTSASQLVYYFTDQASATGLAANDPSDFLVNRLILRSKAKEMGLFAGDVEITNFLQEHRLFAGENQEFDANAYSEFIKNLPGAMTEADFRSLISDLLLHDKLKEVITGGLSMPREQSLSIINASEQSFTADTVEWKRADYVEGISPTEEQIKEYWEKHKGSYMTERKLRVSYVLSTSPRPPAPKAPEITEELSEEEITALNRAYQEEITALNVLHESNVKTLKIQFSEFTNKVEESEGVEFIENDAEDGWKDLKIASTDLLAESELRTLVGNPQKRSRTTGRTEGFIFDDIASSEFGENLQAITDYYPVAPDGYFVMKVEKFIEPQEKTYEQAKEQATAAVTAQLIDEALLAAAEEAREAFSKEGADFANVAKELELEVKPIGPFKPSQLINIPQASQYGPQRIPDQPELHKACLGVKVGGLSEITLTNNGETAVLAKLNKRTLEKNAQPEIHANGQLASFNSNMSSQVFQLWLRNEYLAADKTLPKSN